MSSVAKGVELARVRQSSARQEADYPERAVRGIAQLALLLSGCGLLLMALVIGWQVFGRYVLNDSPSWAESLALLAMLYTVLLAAAVGVHEQFHLGLRLVVTKLPLGTQRVVYVLGQLLVLCFGLAMAYNGRALADYTATHVIPTLGVPRAAAYWPFVASGGLIVLFAAARCISTLRSTSAALGKGASALWS